MEPFVSHIHVLAFITGMPGYAEILIVLFIGLLIFGKRLPEVGKSLGKSIVEFKKGVKGIEDQVDDAVSEPRSKVLPPKEEASPTTTTTVTDKAKEPAGSE